MLCACGEIAVGAKCLWVSRCYGARTSGRSPWGGDTARRRFIGGGRMPMGYVLEEAVFPGSMLRC